MCVGRTETNLRAVCHVMSNCTHDSQFHPNFLVFIISFGCVPPKLVWIVNNPKSWASWGFYWKIQTEIISSGFCYYHWIKVKFLAGFYAKINADLKCALLFSCDRERKIIIITLFVRNNMHSICISWGFSNEILWQWIVNQNAWYDIETI